ncbi:phage holin, LLH family [Limosilactobacillus pontis]|uniref:Phage holin, LLH family n=1 Tax=Limosilactobacillus pontis TaxID=35787 RepID=A0ABU7SV39_9LACO
MKTANDIFAWIFQSGAVIWLFYFGFAIAKPWVDGKIKHAKTAQQREVWALLEQVAMTTVNSLVSSNKPGSQKFLEASDQVQSYLADHGVHIDMKTVQSAVQAAYEKSPLTGNDQSTSTVTVGPEGVTTTIKPADGTATAIDPKEVA